MSRWSGTRAAGAALTASVVGIITVVVGMAVTGVVAPRGFVPPAAADALPAFEDCTQLQTWYRDAALPLVTAYGLPGTFAKSGALDVISGPAMPAMAAAGTEQRSASGAVGNGPTGTNVQEAGVDEPDAVKTDGRHVVGLGGSGLWVADATTDTPRVVGRLALAPGPTQLLLDGDRALVLGFGDRGIRPMGDLAVPQGDSTRLTLVDLSDPTAPRVVSSEDVDGHVVSARLSDGVARVVVSTTPRLAFRAPMQQQDEPSALTRNRVAVAQAKVQDWLPQRTIRDASGTVVSNGPLLSCNDVRHPVKSSGVGTLSVLTVDPHGATPFAATRPTAVAADGDLVYASPDFLYVATSHWGFWQAAPRASDVTTQIHAFDIRGHGAAAYVGSGSVPGYLMSQWAMSEQAGYLRVAVTTGTPQPPVGEGATPATLSQTSVVVLAQRGDQLAEVGRVDGLGRGEQVRAVRWLGNLAAVVTFRQTDPLYLVDLSRPTAPRLRGALELTGYSAYLHPVGDGLLLGIGHEADAAGRIQDAQVSLFDVHDPDHPTRLARRLLGQGWTAVENDTHAFTYLPERRLAVLPFQGYGMGVVSPGVVDGPGGIMPVRPSGGAVGITVGGGQLGDGGTLTVPGYQPVQRVLPVGDRLVAWTGSSLVTADPDGLRVLGSTTVQ